MNAFASSLLKWYRINKRDLPWRQTSDPYKIWISEIMLQQTTVNAVIPYYRKWIKAFPTVRHLARSTLQKVLAQWQGLGYYNRARNLHKSAQVMTDEFGGKVPRDPAVAKKLPGFGPYTVGAVLSIAYGLPLTIIDANVRRVIMRQLALEGFADTVQDVVIRQYLERVLPSQHVGDFNQALMELGALVCRSKEPLCLQCPLSAGCLAYQKGIQEIIPTPKKKIIKDIQAVIAVIENKGKYFIQKRPSKGLLADLWEFPGGKVEAGESCEEALIREMKEELEIDPKSFRHLFDLKHFYTEFRVHLSVWRFNPCKIPKSDATHRWVDPDRFSEYPMPSGSARIVERLLRKNT